MRMNLRPLFVLLAPCVLVAACTTPPHPYDVNGKGAGTSNDASLLMVESANAALAKRFAKASSPPKILHAVAPEMSRAAVNHGGMGTVRVEASVAKDGRVTEVRVLESPNEYLSENVSKALMQWVFSPLIVDGETKDFKFRQPFYFRLRA